MPDDEIYEAYLPGRSLLRRWQTAVSRDPTDVLTQMILGDQARGVAIQHEPRIGPGGGEGCPVLVEPNL